MTTPGGATVLDEALRARLCSAVSAEIGTARAPRWSYAAGRVSFAPDAPPVSRDTPFDLASLTKVLAATSVALDLVMRGMLELAAPVAELGLAWRRAEPVTVRDLLEHCSGLPAHRPYYLANRGRAAFESAIAREPLEYAPRTAAIYSDLGFILLGFLLEDAGGASLDRQFAAWRRGAGMREPLDFSVAEAARLRTARTGASEWRGIIPAAQVHDDNAYALGGVAAHAGLFGTASAVGEVARWWLVQATSQSASSLPAAFLRRSTVPGSSRALGWDTMLPTSSCGTHLSSRAFGHTGFTGTSLWIDPARDLYAVLLTNFVISGHDRAALATLRRTFHDAIIDDLRGLDSSWS